MGPLAKERRRERKRKRLLRNTEQVTRAQATVKQFYSAYPAVADITTRLHNRINELKSSVEDCRYRLFTNIPMDLRAACNEKRKKAEEEINDLRRRLKSLTFGLSDPATGRKNTCAN